MCDTRWPWVTLKDVSSDIKDGTHGTHPRVESGIPLLSAKNVAPTGRLVWSDDDEHISEEEYKIITSSFTPKKEDLLVTVVGTLGRTTLFDGSKIAFQRSVAFVRPNSFIDPNFLLQASKSASFVRQLEQRSNATAQAGLYLGELAKIRIPLPDSEHQVCIAKILSTVDEAIEQTEALIAKTQQIKAGLMHDLFTRGVTKDSQLRPPREEAPQLYKESPLGWIPKEWDVVSISEVVPRAVYGVSVPLDSGPGIPVLRMNNIHDGKAKLSDLKFSQSPLARALLLRPGDVLFNRTNSIEHVGRTGIWQGELPEASFASYLVRLDPNPDRLRAKFLVTWLNWETSQIRIRKFATPGVHQVNINPTNLRRTMIALPPGLEEQDAMMRVLQSNADTLHEYLDDVEKLQHLKQGLMHDLLTGRVRVKTESVPPTESAHV